MHLPKFCLFLLVAVISASAQEGKHQHHPSVEKCIQLLQQGKIDRIELFTIPSSFLTNSAITPAGIESAYWTKTTINAQGVNHVRDKMVRHLTLLKDTAPGRLGDIRVALVFYSGSRSVLSVYFDVSGEEGAINSEPVEFPKGIRDSVLSTIANLAGGP